MIVDFHTHIFPPRFNEYREEYVARDPLFARIYAKPNAKIASCEDLIAIMDEEGIDRSVILNANWSSLELCQETNDHIMESISRYPDRLVGFCSLPPKAEEAAIAELERCVRGGIRGIGEMRPDFHGLERGDEAVMDTIFEVALRHRLILLVHASEPVGHEYVGKQKITPDVLEKLINRFPDMTIVCAHWGGGLPFYALMPEVAEALKNVFFDSSASPYLYRPEIFRHVAEIVGVEKILFGSDYPVM
ncbi:MAG: amidohydrolase family protein, partial [Dehalococcoidia bacterium]|nr:amidohydrolase family protein [Dehalococcoidia bacterium]